MDKKDTIDESVAQHKEKYANFEVFCYIVISHG